MWPIGVLEFFGFLLQKDAKAFHADETSKQKNWNSINREFSEKETESSKQWMEKIIINKPFKKGKKE